MAAAIEAVDRMATLARTLGAERLEAVATSAVRDASNANEFLGAVRRATGLTVRVLDGEEEALLSFRSAIAHFDMAVGRSVVVDIGGGSLELALAAEGVIERLRSLPYGAIRLTEEFFDKGITPKAVHRLRDEVAAGIGSELPRRAWRGAQLIGSGGTFTNLAGIFLARQGVLTARSVHASRIPRSDLEHILDALTGVAVAAEVLRRLDAREIVVSRYGIREGLLLEAAHVTPTIADPGEARARSVAELAMRCHAEQPHSSHVQRLALVLFDAIGERIGLTKADRQTLADAALLHDCGYHISYERHHKHSYHLIVHADLLGMPPSEQVVIANVARYHRGAPPRKKQRNFGRLDKALRSRIERLAALLRVADGFDRGHVSAVSDLKVRRLKRALRITPVAANQRATMRLEMWGASRKAGLLAELIGAPVEIIAPDGTIFSSDDDDDGELE
jgi:exopolyphosphatase/guanosine-5'-triphosphate,3'-diphosphate pyrophosphatase